MTKVFRPLRQLTRTGRNCRNAIVCAFCTEPWLVKHTSRALCLTQFLSNSLFHIADTDKTKLSCLVRVGDVN